MLGMLSFLFLLCAAAFVVFTALLIIRSVKKQPKKPFVIMAAASFILAIGLTMPISSLYKPSEKTSDGITHPRTTACLRLKHPSMHPTQSQLQMLLLENPA